MDKYKLYFDGASSGNPGPIGIGCAIYKNDELIETISKSVGEGTNNKAEYSALIEGLNALLKYSPKTVEVFGDSQLVINQLDGFYRVKSEKIIPLYEKAKDLSNKFENVKFTWIKRDINKVADNLASMAIGQDQGLFKDGEFIEWSSDRFQHKVDYNAVEDLPKLNEDTIDFINRFNRWGDKVKFNDHVKLKTYGKDNYSSIKASELLDIIEIRFGQETKDWLVEVLANANNRYQLNTLRWAARGLNPDLALKKASVDEEIATKLGKKKTWKNIREAKSL